MDKVRSTHRMLALTSAVIVTATLAVGNRVLAAEPLGTAFTYQGQLKKDGKPVSGQCNLWFRLWDSAVGGSQIGDMVFFSLVEIEHGLLTSVLNEKGEFGPDAFDGERRWLEVSVECAGDDSKTTLPRQELTPAPYAHFAKAAPWDGLAGVPKGFADNVDDDTTYDGSDFALSNQSCTPGDVVTGISETGDITCAPDIDTTYDGTDFALSDQACLAGDVVTGVDDAGAVTCAPDIDTLSGLSCTDGQLAKWDGAAWVCDDDIDTDTDTTYDGTDFALSDQSCVPGDVVIGISESGNITCAPDIDTTYDGSDFTLSNQSCTPGDVVTGVDAVGNLTCAPDADTLGALLCANGQVAKWDGAAWVCDDDLDSGGDITSVDAKDGLLGGGDTGDINVSVDFSGTGSATTVARSDHDHDVSGPVPIGTVTAWLKSFPNSPSLQDGWVECNGQELSDPDSVYDGQTIPLLNSSTEGSKRFLRGSTTSGAVGGSTSHSHGQSCYDGQGSICAANNQGAGHIPPYYEVVWIMKVR